MDKKKAIHGNNARIDEHKHIESLYQMNAVTAIDHIDDETPIPSDSNVKAAKKFVDQNHK